MGYRAFGSRYVKSKWYYDIVLDCNIECRLALYLLNMVKSMAPVLWQG